MSAPLYNVCTRCYCHKSGACPGTPFSPIRSLGERMRDLLGSAACRRLRFADTDDGLEIRIAFPYTIPWHMLDERGAAGAVCDRMLSKRWFNSEDRVSFLRAVYEHWGWDGPAVILCDISGEREV